MGFSRAVGSIATSLARRSRATATILNTAPSYISRYPTSPFVRPLTTDGYRRSELQRGLYDGTRPGTAWGVFGKMINPSGSAQSSAAPARTGKTFTLHPDDPRLPGVDPALMSWTTGPDSTPMVQVTCTPSRFPSMTADGLAKYNEFISRLDEPVETDRPKKPSIDRFTGLDAGANTRVDEYYKFCMGEITHDPYRQASDTLPPWNPYTQLSPPRPSIIDILSTRATAKEEAAQATAQAFTAEATTTPATEFTLLEGLDTEGLTIQTVRDDIISAITTLREGGAGQAMLNELGDVYAGTAGVNPTGPSAGEFESCKADVMGKLKTRWTSCVEETMNFYPDVTNGYREAHQKAADELRRAVTVLSCLTWQETATPTENDTLDPLTGLNTADVENTEFNTAGHTAGRVNTTLGEDTWKNYQEALQKDAEGKKRHVRERLARIRAEEAAAASAASGSAASGKSTGVTTTTTTPSSNDTVLDSSTPLTSTPASTASRTETSRPFSSIADTANTANTAGTASTLGSQAVGTDTDSESLDLDQWPDFDGDMYGPYSRFRATVEDYEEGQSRSDDSGTSNVTHYHMRAPVSSGASTYATFAGSSQPAESSGRTVGGGLSGVSSGHVVSTGGDTTAAETTTAETTRTAETTTTGTQATKRKPGKKVGFAGLD